MRRGVRSLCFVAAATVHVVALLHGSTCRAEPSATQAFELRPGWNAVFLEVQPEPHDPASVFQGLPIESVWTWIDRRSPVQFIQDPNEEPWGQPGWSVYFTDEAKAYLTNLHAVFAGWPYLVKVAGRKNLTWNATGVPSATKIRWVADSFNLVGFGVDPAAPPSFAEFLTPSSAHTGQAVYQLGEGGDWEIVRDPSAAEVRSGVAYWVYCEGGSTYQGPMELTFPMAGGLDYGTALTEHALALVNHSDTPRAVTFALSSTAVALAYRRYAPSTGYFEWLPLASMPPLVIEPGRQTNVRLAVRREQMTAGVSESVLTVMDGAGTRYRAAVRAEKIE